MNYIRLPEGVSKENLVEAIKSVLDGNLNNNTIEVFRKMRGADLDLNIYDMMDISIKYDVECTEDYISQNIEELGLESLNLVFGESMRAFAAEVVEERDYFYVDDNREWLAIQAIKEQWMKVV